MSVEMFKRHCGKEIDIKLKNDDGIEDTFKFKPMDMEQYGLFLILSSKLSKSEMDMDKNDVQDLIALFKSIISNSYPGLDEQTVSLFMASNFASMTEVLAKLAPVKLDEEQQSKLKDKIDKIKAMRK